MKTQIQKEIRDKDNKLVEYSAIKKVVKAGTGGGVTLPKELIGKMVRIEMIWKHKQVNILSQETSFKR